MLRAEILFQTCGTGKSQWGWPEVLLVLWEGGWEWTRLTKSIYISIEITCLSSLFSLLSSLYTYSLLVYSSLVAEYTRKRHRFLPCVIFALKTRRFVRGCPKKVEKTSSENTTFENSEHPYRTCGPPGGLFCFSVPPLRHGRGSSPMSFSFWKLAFRSWLSQKSRKNVKRKHYFWKFGAPLSHLRLVRRDFFLLVCLGTSAAEW